MDIYRYMEQVYGQAPRKEEGPAHEIEGVLYTKNYKDFTIYSNDGRPLHSFSGAKLANRCLSGDHVWWSGTQCELELRDEHPLIVGTIELTNPSRYGMTRKKVPMYLFTPYDSKYPHFIVGCSERDMTQNRIALVKLDDWTESSPFPRGLVEQHLGRSGEWEAEKKALEWQACPWRYPKHAYTPERTEEEKDIQSLEGYTFHIDPLGCRDVDDVITMNRLTSGDWELTISISDVAGYVEDGSAIDIMASLIGETLYDSDGKVIRPMLPPEYSEGACSLVPGKESYGVSLQTVWNGSTLSQGKWFIARFHTQRSYHYDECKADDSEYFQALQEISSYLAKESLSDAHQWIEQLMIYYNKEAGKILKTLQQGILRRHKTPDEERWRAYQIYLPEWKNLAMSSAEYCLAEEKESWHFGLDTDEYAHASSPIRRYADLVNQRILKQWIQGTSTSPYIVPITMNDLNQRSKAIRRYARDMDYLRALESGLTQFQAIIMEKKDAEDGKVKLRLYVPTWRRMVSTLYKKGSKPDWILSRDEMDEISTPLYSSIMITCTFHLQMRNWKDRAVLRIDPLPTSEIK